MLRMIWRILNNDSWQAILEHPPYQGFCAYFECAVRVYTQHGAKEARGLGPQLESKPQLVEIQTSKVCFREIFWWRQKAGCGDLYFAIYGIGNTFDCEIEERHSASLGWLPESSRGAIASFQNLRKLLAIHQ
jgi:hypothetical protein